MRGYNKIKKKELDLIRKEFSHMISEALKKQVRFNIIKSFFLKEAGSKHDLLEKINEESAQTHGIDPIGIRALEKLIQKLKKEKKLRIESKRPTNDELAAKYGLPIPEYKQYSHKKDRVKITAVSFLKLQKGFNFPNEITGEEKSIFQETIEVLRRVQDETNNINTDLIDLLSDFVSHELVFTNKIQHGENKSYKKGYDIIKKALLDETPLKIKLKDLKKEMTSEIEFHPHFLKFWKNKWYAFGLNPKREEYPYVLPVDTLIVDAAPILKKYKKSFFSFLDQDGNSEFFDDIIGVTNYKSKPKKEIIIKVHTQDRYNRLKLNRAHSRMVFHDEIQTIRMCVKRNKELENFIMEHSDEVEIIEPKSLRNKIFKKIKSAHKIYSAKE